MTRESSRPSVRVLKVISFALALLAGAVLCFLGVWYFEVVLWLILGPFAFASLYLAFELWIVSPRATRALICWAISLAWLLALVLGSFKDVTIVGALIAVTVMGLLISLVHVFLRDARKSRSDGADARVETGV
jgi:hypothetical protein